MTTNTETRCTCGQGHTTFGECMRAKGIRVGYCRSAAGHDYTRERKWDQELQAYRDARRQGVQPSGTTMPKIREAMEISEKSGEAYDASAGN